MNRRRFLAVLGIAPIAPSASARLAKSSASLPVPRESGVITVYLGPDGVIGWEGSAGELTGAWFKQLTFSGGILTGAGNVYISRDA